MIDCLGLRHYVQQLQPSQEKPLIVLGPMEHHSNLLPWRELGNVDIVTIRLLPKSGQIDLQHLESILQQNVHRTIKIGSFAAASNITGTVVDDRAITALLHQYGALSVWDYATGASYLDMNMNPSPSKTEEDPSMYAKDAIFFSGHKLLGGIGTPGVLIVKKKLVSQLNPPNLSGGGTVFYVTEDHHRFLSNRIERYEGGTPNVVGIWRLGLVFKYKQQLQKKQLQQQRQQQHQKQKQSSPSPLAGNNKQVFVDLECQRAQSIQKRLKQIPNLVLLDGAFTYHDLTNHHQGHTKVPIFSFLIKCGPRFLHYNYVCAILNDIFGIQSRGGCQCAGPYAQHLLGMTTHGEGTNQAVEDWLVHSKDELMRPGATRFSLPMFGISEEQEDYVLTAIEWIAQHGWKFLHVYRCNHRAGEWRHKSRPGAPLGKQERVWLSHFRHSTTSEKSDKDGSPISLQQALDNANQVLQLILQDQSSISQAIKMTHEISSSSSLRWYVYPKDVAQYIQQGLEEVPGTNDRSNLLGAIRPLAWYPQELQSNDNSYAQTATNSSSKEGQTYPFRDGDDHSGEASLQEIQEGYDDGELSEACQVYDRNKDSWEHIVVFLGEMTLKNDAAIDKKNNSLAQPKNNSSVITQNNPIAFRDGEHTGEASLEEIQAGWEDGELSNRCLVYNRDTKTWEPINSIQLLGEEKKDDDEFRKDIVDDGVDDDAALESKTAGTLNPKAQFDSPAVVPKNEKKKPQRDSSTWGRGNMVNLEAPNTKDTTAEPPQTRVPSKQKRHKHIKPPAKLMRLVTQAMLQWEMLEDGDRLLLGLSGGKDSLSLLHVLLEFQKKLPINFEIEVCTIDPMTPSFDPSPLIPYVESLGLKYHYIRDDIVERAAQSGKDGKMVSSLCAYCARMKRGHLYTCARENNCNKLVLAQHLDDLAESFMMSVMHNGFLRTMKANYRINAGDLSVIRPLVYSRESLTTDFAKSANLPIINENCPACFEEPKERARIKKLLSREETLYPNFYDNIKRSILPLMHDDSTAILRSYTEEALAKSRKENKVKRQPNDVRKNSNSPENYTLGEGDQVSHEEQKKKTLKKGTAFSSCVPNGGALLADASEEELLKELGKRRAERFRLIGAMKRLGDNEDPTGQVCTLNGGNGSIPCRELME